MGNTDGGLSSARLFLVENKLDVLSSRFTKSTA